jgi:DNA-directed RNA polymerase subunit RPC12/RpoP
MNAENIEKLKTVVARADGVHKERKLVDCFVVVEPEHIPYAARQDERERLACLERWAKEFLGFIRDHRHQDVNSVEVRRVYETVCSGCGNSWEEAADGNGVFCAYCGEPIEHRDVRRSRASRPQRSTCGPGKN